MGSCVTGTGSFTPLDFPGASSTAAQGINSQGDIVGTYSAGGITHGFLANGSAAQRRRSRVPMTGADPPEATRKTFTKSRKGLTVLTNGVPTFHLPFLHRMYMSAAPQGGLLVCVCSRRPAIRLSDASERSVDINYGDILLKG